jgi:hypothetical protein
MLKGLKQRGLAVSEIFFPKSYFQQTASKSCFLELIFHAYLLGKHHNMSPLRRPIPNLSNVSQMHICSRV